eukprot:CAMPEP_0113943954 /NCGR_PEP_ID=MMETSP1339-20121228/29923_1 /TAXON_ID=94617 /ORGANISM="Fibrocapsa japonica" /LENGTH=160 /DNA_ID=CAMNT_0000948975 /DNA_START=314 /DNA_END=796 /DNA_ORIENTATION=+ /assembly_acc=CAM_ASM_000762
MAQDDESVPIDERIFAILPYALPLSDSIEFGRFIFAEFPLLRELLDIFIGIFYDIYRGVPFIGLLIFLAFSVASRTPSIPRFARFSIQQALLIDIALIFPQLFGGLAKELPLSVVEPATNFVFYAAFASCTYSVISNALGKVPNEIPLISQSAETSIGPF